VCVCVCVCDNHQSMYAVIARYLYLYEIFYTYMMLNRHCTL
jgi:hypothetical protein